MDDLAHHGLEHLAQFTPHAYDLLDGIDTNLLNHAEDVPVRGRCFRTHDEIGPAEEEEVEEVVFGHEGKKRQFPQHLGRGRRLDLPQVVEAFGRCDVVRCGAHATDTRCNARHLLGRAAETEGLEPAQLRNLQEGAMHLAVVIEEDFDFAVSLEAGDGIDGDAFVHCAASRGATHRFRREDAMLKR